jgi:hypothetical protein
MRRRIHTICVSYGGYDTIWYHIHTIIRTWYVSSSSYGMYPPPHITYNYVRTYDTQSISMRRMLVCILLLISHTKHKYDTHVSMYARMIRMLVCILLLTYNYKYVRTYDTHICVCLEYHMHTCVCIIRILVCILLLISHISDTHRV